MPPEVAVVEVTRTRTVVVEVPGPSYSDARVLAYLRTVLNANGDLLTVAAGTLARVGIGSSGQVLTVSGGAAVWAAPTGFANPMSAHGDLIIGGASGVATRLPRGTNGQILSVSGSTLAWIDAPASYTDADAISAIAGEATDSQLFQRVNANSIQGISLATIYDGAQDHIEALGNGVLITAGGVLDNVVGTEGQVLTWTGGTAIFAAASGGYTDPLTTNGDMVVRAGGVTTRLPVGSDGQVLRVSGGAPTWGADVGFANPMTNAGDMIAGQTAGAAGRLALGVLGFDLGASATAPQWRPTRVLHGAVNDWGAAGTIRNRFGATGTNGAVIGSTFARGWDEGGKYTQITSTATGAGQFATGSDSFVMGFSSPYELQARMRPVSNTNVVYGVQVATASLGLVTSPGAGQFGFGFVRAPSDTNWLFQPFNNGAGAPIDTGVAFDATKVWDFVLAWDGSGTARWALRPLGGLWVSGSTSLNIPTTATDCYVRLGAQTTTTSAVSCRVHSWRYFNWDPS